MKTSGKSTPPSLTSVNAERKRNEEEVRYRSLFEQSPYGVLVIDTQGHVLDFNDAAHRQLGYSREEFARLRIADLDPIQSPEEIRRSIEDIARKGKAEFEVKHRAKNGDIRDVQVITQALVISGQTVFHTIWRDITEQKRAQEAIKYSEEKFRTLFDSASDAIFILDLDGRFIDINRTAYKRLGYSKEEMLSMHVSRLHSPAFAGKVPERIALVREQGHAVVHSEHVRKDGTVMPVEINAKIIDYAEKKAIFSIIRDITERKKLEEALRSSRDFIERILNTVDEAFIVIDRDYRIMMANNAYAAQAGMAIQDIIGNYCHEISHRSSMPCFESGEECSIQQCFETGEPHSCVHRHTSKDGSTLYVETKAFPLKDAAGNVTSAIEVINNMTDKHLLEEQILRTQKLEAVGLLAGGLAHDFNNLLQGVFGNISMAKMFSDKGGKAYAMLEGAETALYQATNLTKQLLTFSKGGEPVKRVIDLPSLVDNAVKFSLSGSNVNYRSAVDDRLWPVEADDGQINQVIHNIVLNACEAMPDGGTVAIEMQNVTINEKNSLPLKQGKYVQLDIKDSGTGISASHLPKIFDPYFTTKKKGSGLGLATSYSIVTKHGGMITASSQLGVGSVFSIYLPASGKSIVPAEVQAGGLLTGKGRILIMDDEEIVRSVAGHMIESLGYEVDFSENGEQAIEKYSAAKRSNRPFHAVILDLTVRGGMGGKEAVGRLAAIDPEVRAIVSSGYSADDIISNYREYGFQEVLSKPYQIDVLGRVLYNLLHRENIS
jgi:PAS domain S-box-containing protein